MKRNYYFLVLFVIVLNSCDCIFDYRFEVSNALNSNITIKYNSRQSEEKVITLKPGETGILYSGDGFLCACTDCKGSPINSVDSTINYFIPNLKIFKNDSIQTITDFNKEKNWSFVSKKRLGVYTAKVKEADF
jgi:hypothetical protein